MLPQFREMYSFSTRISLIVRNKFYLSKRLQSAWLNQWQQNPKIKSKFECTDLERLFVDQRVQTLLKSLTGFNVEKLHIWKMTIKDNRKHYALMTDGMYKEFIKSLAKRTQPFLQFVPMKEPRENITKTLSINPEISGHDTSKIVFTDIGHNATKIDRTIVICEPNGRLRTALPEEHYRMHRIYYDQPNRPVKEPPLFTIEKKDGISYPGPVLSNALSANEHVFVLDWACYFYEPDHPKFVELCKCIFKWTIQEGKLDVLHLTRHFGPLTIYMLINGQIHELLNFFSSKESIVKVANTIRLYRLIYPDWKTTISLDDSNDKVIQDFIETMENQSNPLEYGKRALDSLKSLKDLVFKSNIKLKNTD